MFELSGQPTARTDESLLLRSFDDLHLHAVEQTGGTGDNDLLPFGKTGEHLYPVTYLTARGHEAALYGTVVLART